MHYITLKFKILVFRSIAQLIPENEYKKLNSIEQGQE